MRAYNFRSNWLSRLCVKLLLLANCFMSGVSPNLARKKVILVLVESFPQWLFNSTSYKHAKLSGLHRLFKEGSRVDYVLSEFPTLSLPNIYSLTTGLYPRRHGITGNVMLDERRNQYFDALRRPSDVTMEWWNRTAPIWLSAHNQGLRTALYWWPTCQVKFQQEKPECLLSAAENSTDDFRRYIPDILHDIENHDLDFALIYYDMIDVLARKYGPYSGKTISKVEEFSSTIFELQQAMEAYDMFAKTNLIVASTHGISELPMNKLFFLEDCDIDMSKIEKVVDNGSWMLIYPVKGKTAQVYQELDGKMPHSRLFWRDQLLERWRLAGASHLPPLILLSSPGHGIYSQRTQTKQFPALPRLVTAADFPKALSGYDNAADQMRGVFMARGPDFKRNHVSGWIRVVDVYQVLCHIMAIRCHENDGSWDRVRGMLNSCTTPQLSKMISWTFCCILLLLRILKH